MKGDSKVIRKLNDLLADEHTAICQYTIHASVSKRFGKLNENVANRIKCKMRFQEMLIERILFLGGIPELTNVREINVSSNIIDVFVNDKEQQLTSIAGCIEAISAANEFNDFGTAQMLQAILSEEESCLNDIETNMFQIEQIGIERFLSVQIGG